MNKRVFIVHRWDGSPKKDWIPKTAEFITNQGYDIVVPEMPTPSNPKIDTWVQKLKEVIDVPRKDDIFIGHSIGCQTILRYIEQLPEEQRIDKVILIAPWFVLTNLETDRELRIAQPWITTPINFEEVTTKVNKFTALFSDNDPSVPMEENIALLKERLTIKIIRDHNKGHFTREDGVTQMPELLGLL